MFIKKKKKNMSNKIANKNIKFTPTRKQHQMFKAFNNSHTTELLYGGS